MRTEPEIPLYYIGPDYVPPQPRDPVNDARRLARAWHAKAEADIWTRVEVRLQGNNEEAVTLWCCIFSEVSDEALRDVFAALNVTKEILDTRSTLDDVVRIHGHALGGLAVELSIDTPRLAAFRAAERAGSAA